MNTHGLGAGFFASAALLLASLAASPAHADPDSSVAQVTWIAVPGFGGGMKRLPEGKSTGLVEVVPAGASTAEPLAQGRALHTGDTLVCGRAQVMLTTPTGEQIHLREGASLTLTADRTVLQRIGAVYYQVRSAFRVQYGTVETAVEGTTFVVEGAEREAGRVAVRLHEGRVRVTEGDKAVVLTRGQTTQVTPGRPGPEAPRRWGALTRGASLQRSLGPGAPSLVIGVVAGGVYRGDGTDLLPGGLSPLVEAVGSVRLQGPLRLRMGAGGSRTASRSAWSAQVSPELSLGPLSGGLGIDVSQEERSTPCLEQTVQHVGGVGHLRLDLPIGSRLRVLAEGRVTGGSVLQGAGAVGVGWAL